MLTATPPGIGVPATGPGALLHRMGRLGDGRAGASPASEAGSYAPLRKKMCGPVVKARACMVRARLTAFPVCMDAHGREVCAQARLQIAARCFRAWAALLLRR